MLADNKMANKFKISFLFLCLTCGALGTPAVSDVQSLVVSSTEPSKENSSEANEAKEDNVPKVPKIYEMKVDTNVSNRFATTLITSRVKNLAKTPQEATFAVVLPETGYITGFVMEIDGKNYTATIKEKQEAKQIYNDAIQSGQAAAHVEANARDSNRFTVSLNIEPESKAIFRLTYEELLKRQNEQYEVVINIHPGQPVKDLTVNVNINETRPLKFVRSPALRSGNEISKNDEKLEAQADIKIENSTAATVKFNPDIERQKQLANGLGTKEENGLAGQFVVQYDVERDPQGGEVLVKDGYFVHFFAPTDLKALPKQVVFVLDTSGSMDGNRIKQLKEAMNSILAELKPEDLFNIVEFSSIVKVWNVETVEVQYESGTEPWGYQPYGEPQPKKSNLSTVLPLAYEASEENINKAKQVVGKLNAYGGTDIKNGLEVGLKLIKKQKEDTNSTHQPLIVFLTDGEPTVGETDVNKIISAIKEYNSGEIKTPIFSLSFGDGADRDFLQKISLKNLGFARHIYEAADASLQLQEFYKQISSPLLNNVKFNYVSNVTKVTKTVFPIYFHGSELVVAGIAEDEIVDPNISAYSIRGPIVLRPHVENPVGSLERLWAYLTVKQILEARDAADNNKTLLTKKALDISLKYSFVTPVSSLVVVKPNQTEKAVNTEDASKPRQDQPLYHKSASYHGGPLFLNSPLQNFHYASAGGFGTTQPQSAFESAALIPSTPFRKYVSSIRGYSNRRPVHYFRPTPLRFSADVDADEPVDRIYGGLSTPAAPVFYSTTNKPKITDQLPWLKNILTENGTIAIENATYKLSTDETVNIQPPCTATPTGTNGTCTLLPECPQVFNLLTDEKVFKQYFCPLDTFVGICCPTTTIP